MVFNNKCSHKAIAGMWKQSIETYAYIKVFEFTSNGGGDPDCDDLEGILKSKLEGARKASLAVRTLKPAVITTWEANGWLKLFSDW
jgi:hypothetical protein